MAISAASVLRGPGEIAQMVADVARLVFASELQLREFIEQATLNQRGSKWARVDG